MGRAGIEMNRDIADTQAMVLAALRDTSTSQAAPNPLLEEVATCNDAAITRLGNVGKALKKYVSQVALQHPDLLELTKEKDWDAFSRDVMQAITMPDSSDPGGVLAAVQARLNDYKSILRLLATPKPRLLRDPLQRNDVREEKKHAKHIGLKQVYMLGENGFYGKPDNFKLFVRNSDAHVAELSGLETQQKVFLDHSLPEVAHAVNKRIKALNDMRVTSYLGFHRLKPTDAAIIAARMHEIRWHELHFLTVPFKSFEGRYWAEPEPRKEDKEDMKRLLVTKDKKGASADAVAFSYQPRLYQLAKFPELPRKVTEIISIVESFPELNGCPVFDYYWVLMPSININHPYFRTKDGWKVYVRSSPWCNPELKSFTDEYEAALALDEMLIADGYFNPIILGEREGMCYFLCEME